jgi:hypothetical protein
MIAWPVVYYLMRNWLDAFEFRIDIEPLLFLGSGLLAAHGKPIHALRYE